MTALERDRDADKLHIRAWEKISMAWAEHIPTIDDEIPWPGSEVEDLQELKPYYGQLRTANVSHRGAPQPLEGAAFLYPEIFLASLAYARRAAHVLRAAAKHSESGFRSWSRSSAYHAAYFGMQSIIRLLGAVVLQDKAHGETFQFDLWCDNQVRSHKMLSGTDAFVVTGYLRTRGTLRHVDLWSIFSRLLRVTKMPAEVWPYRIADRYKSLPRDSFPSLRNELNYRLSCWPFDDFNTALPPEDMRAKCSEALGTDWVAAPDDGNFPICLGIQVVVMALKLLESVTPEGQAIRNTIEGWRQELSAIDLDADVILGIA